MKNELELTPSQTVAYEAFRTWLESNNPKKYGNETRIFLLNGEAGTGKTFMLQQYIDLLKTVNIKTSLVAFTGKAASRMQELTGENACTIHRLIYEYNLTRDLFYDQDEEQKEFDENKSVKAAINSQALIIDEYSMLSTDMIKDLLSLNKMLIFSGDLNQLAPIKEEIVSHKKFCELANKESIPCVVLTDPVRQSLDNPILSTARKIKAGLSNLGKYFTFNPYNESEYVKVIGSKEELEWSIQLFAFPENIIICTTNEMCKDINTKVRRANKFKDLLNPGEKIIITRNNKDEKVYNGESYEVLEVKEPVTRCGIRYLPVVIDKNTGSKNTTQLRQLIWLSIDRLLDPGWKWQVDRDLPEKDKYEQYGILKSLVYANYGYAITGHKAQGSEWESVYIIYKKSSYFGNRWLYTALTRAKKRCIIRIR